MFLKIYGYQPKDLWDIITGNFLRYAIGSKSFIILNFSISSLSSLKHVMDKKKGLVLDIMILACASLGINASLCLT